MAKYNPTDPRDYLAALAFINHAKEQDFAIELKKYYRPRTNRQNAYLHFALSWFAHCYGCTLVEAKEIYLKRFACKDMFRVETQDRDGKPVHYYRSTADLTTAELSSVINNFIAWASINGIEIPLPDDELSRRYCEQQMQTTAYCR